ncbi:MAG: hypothetical protein ACFCVE_01900 [Phycisphaerae bacterium]
MLQAARNKFGQSAALLVGACALAVCAPGCGGGAGPALPAAGEGVPVGMQLAARQPNLRLYPFSTLLDFESSADAVFVKAAEALHVESPASTGRGSLLIGRGLAVARVNLAALTLGREWPGDWTLLVAHVYAESDAQVSFAFADAEGGAGPTLAPQYRMPGGKWVPVLLEVPPASGAESSRPPLVLQVQARADAAIYLDDVLAVDNSRTWPEGASEADGWLRQVGGRLEAASAAGTVSLRPRRPGVEPFTVKEAGALRAVLSEEGGKQVVIWRDGRVLRDGAPVPKPPCRPEIAESEGRLLRTTSGDADNDGFNERLGAFQIAATRPTLQVRLLPTQPASGLTALEVFDLPPGEVLASVEGKRIETHDRLPDGRVLVVLPMTLTRPTSLELRVR